jgi:hypothetical protein
MRWSGDPQHFPFAGADNVFWNIWASHIPVKFDYVGRLANSNRRTDMYLQRRMTKLPVMSRPASIQGYGQVVVDMPLDNQIPPIKEVCTMCCALPAAIFQKQLCMQHLQSATGLADILMPTNPHCLPCLLLPFMHFCRI